MENFYCKALAESINEQERSLVAWASTGVIDRDNEILNPRGWDLEAFKTNPVILWAHDSWSLPIGKALWVKPVKEGDKRGLKFKVKFQDKTQAAEDVWQLFKDGFLNAFSVGFRPTAGEELDPTENDGARYRYNEQELLEISAVPVPANPEALVNAIRDGKYKSAFIKTLAGLDPEAEEQKDMEQKIIDEINQRIDALEEKYCFLEKSFEETKSEEPPEPEPETVVEPEVAPEPKAFTLEELEAIADRAVRRAKGEVLTD